MQHAQVCRERQLLELLFVVLVLLYPGPAGTGSVFGLSMLKLVQGAGEQHSVGDTDVISFGTDTLVAAEVRTW